MDKRVCRASAYRSAITEVGTLLKRHTLDPSPTIPLHSVAQENRLQYIHCHFICHSNLPAHIHHYSF